MVDLPLSCVNLPRVPVRQIFLSKVAEVQKSRDPQGGSSSFGSLSLGRCGLGML